MYSISASCMINAVNQSQIWFTQCICVIVSQEFGIILISLKWVPFSLLLFSYKFQFFFRLQPHGARLIPHHVFCTYNRRILFLICFMIRLATFNFRILDYKKQVKNKFAGKYYNYNYNDFMGYQSELDGCNSFNSSTMLIHLSRFQQFQIWKQNCSF